MATVFLSYRHADDVAGRVRAFADQLEAMGVSVLFDQFAQEREFNGGGPDGGWPRWSKKKASGDEWKILIVATRGWFRCYEGTEAPGTGLGAAAEAAVIEQRLYNAAGVAKNIRLVAFDELDQHSIPLDLQRYHHFAVPRDNGDVVRWLTEGLPRHFPADWPERLPAISWQMADHTGARDAFAQLIVGNTHSRYLPIKGASETGKSHITRQFLGNALRIEGLACGRFDFKGTTDVEAELQRLVHHLEVPLPSAGSLTHRLTHVLAGLAARGRPALLIFDTFESAGGAEEWVKDHLLVSLIRCRWLRVVIAGQRVPERGGAPWDTEAFPAIQLSVPAPEDWYEYGLVHRPNIDLEFVSRAHQLCGGKSSVLAQLLGPPA